MKSLDKLIRFYCLINLFILCLHLPLLGNSGEDKSLNQDLQVLKAVKPILPANVAKTGVTEGFAIIVFIVDNKGLQNEFVQFAASHPAFARSTIRAIKRWGFSPRIVNGVAYASRVFVKASYTLESGGGGGIVDASIIVEAMFKNKTINRSLIMVSDINELDHEPKISKSISPVYPLEMWEAEASGQVLVEFFIDTQGKVKAAGIKSSSNDYFAVAALTAIKEWKFQAPMKGRKRVTARAYQPFFFEYKHFDNN